MTDNVEQELVVMPLALVNDILAYLGTRTYTEAAPYITAIQKDSKLVPTQPAETGDMKQAPELPEKEQSAE